jgi:pyruvate,water dikinase
MEALLWAVERTFETERSGQRQGREDLLVGVAASPGRYTGPVRLVMDETQFGRIQLGDVLVCPVTSPVWSVLFPNIGALVADTRGVLSHPAIIAPEYRIPAVVATGNNTRLLSDGQLVTVDGSQGTVEVEVQS